MSDLNVKQEQQNISELRKQMLELGISYSDVPKTCEIEERLRIWFNARKSSLLLGSLEDSDVKIFLDNKFDFGIKLLCWEEWCDLVKQQLEENASDYIAEGFVVDSKYKVGKWIKRQNNNWKNLSYKRQAMLLNTGIKLRTVYETSSPFQFVFFHDGIKYMNAIDFFRDINVPLIDVMLECKKWGDSYVKVLVKKHGGLIEEKFVSVRQINEQSDLNRRDEKKEIERKRNIDCIEKNDYVKARTLECEEILKPQKRIDSVVRCKLLGFASEEVVDKFMQLISDKYKSLIAANDNYPTLSSFDDVKIKRMFIVNRYVSWEEYKVIINDGYLYAYYFAYVLCSFSHEKKELKRIELEIKYGGSKESEGGFYCEGEEYISLSNKEINNLLKTSLGNFEKTYEDYLKRKVYQQVFDIIDEIEKKSGVIGHRKVDNMINEFKERKFVWEENDGVAIKKIISDKTVSINRIKKEDDEFPDIYVMANIHTYKFEPYLTTRLCILYKGSCYLFNKNWNGFEFYTKVSM